MIGRGLWLNLLAVTFICAVAGCGAGTPKVYKVTAVVRLGGEPFGPCQLFLQPLSKEKDAHSAVGVVDEGGNVVFTTYKIGDGVPAGEYKVMVRSAFAAPPPTPIPAKYQSEAKSTLRITVRDSGTNEAAIDMEVDKSKPSGSTGPNDISAKMNEVFQSDAFKAQGGGGTSE